MSEHSVLAPSSAHRWLVCTPSARLEEHIKSSSTYAEEGSLAHSMAETALKFNTSADNPSTIGHFQLNPLYSSEMPHEVGKYVEYVNDITTDTAQRFIEVKLDMSFIAPNHKGTADAIVINNDMLSIVDLKYGKGVRVDAENNPQQMLYAVAALNMLDIVYDINKVNLCIHQPRLNHISEWQISVSDLRKWVTETVKPAADRAYKGEGSPIAGEHCKFCKVKGNCRALAEHNIRLAEYNFKAAPLLSNSEIANILKQLPIFKDWATSVEDYAYAQLMDGKSVIGFKLVEGRGKRVITNQNGLIEALHKAGYKDTEIHKTELLGLTALESMIGKKQFSIISNSFIERVKGSPTIALETDLRPEYSESIFKPVENE